MKLMFLYSHGITCVFVGYVLSEYALWTLVTTKANII